MSKIHLHFDVNENVRFSTATLYIKEINPSNSDDNLEDEMALLKPAVCGLPFPMSIRVFILGELPLTQSDLELSALRKKILSTQEKKTAVENALASCSQVLPSSCQSFCPDTWQLRAHTARDRIWL
jgi:hypothetical protein